MKPNIFLTMQDLDEKGEPFVLCTIIGSQGSTPRHMGSKMIVLQDGSIVGTVGGGEVEQRVREAALQILKTGKAQLVHYDFVDPDKGGVGVCGGQVDIFIEPVVNSPKVVILGTGHVGRAVAHLAKWSGFRVAVSDDRLDYCSKELLPEANEVFCGPIEEVLNHIALDQNCFVVLTTRSSDLDVAILPQLVKIPLRYIGVIGSKRRWKVTREALVQAGIPVETLDQIYTPIGLSIGGETPEEIAISIMAQIISIWRRQSEV